MKQFIALIVLLTFVQKGYSQTDNLLTTEKYTAKNKGKVFVSWGGNRGYFTDSDIRFRGENYDFTLHDVKAHDKPKGWHVDYINPVRMTIPQTNFKVGYFLTDNYSISLGVDHMKYVMYQDKTVKYSGNYPDRGSYGEAINDGEVFLTEDFLTFEHTDGLNYIYVELSRWDDISKWFNIRNTDLFQINLTEGFGAGVLLPKTNTKLLSKERYDEFHLSGYGMSAKAGLNFTFFKHFFLQTELKGGYINMPSVRTTQSSSDKASHSFYFGETIISFGGIFRI